MANYVKIDEFKEGESWTEYTERLGHYFIANDIDNETKRKAILFTVCGSKTYSLIKSLMLPASPANKSFKEIVDLVEAHCSPKPNKIIACHHFYKRDRQPGESVVTYVAALHRLTEYCEHGNIFWMTCSEIGCMETATKNAENLKSEGQPAISPLHLLQSQKGGQARCARLRSGRNNLKVEGIDLTMGIDTGASVSVVGETTYNRLGRPKLKATKTVLRTYTGEPIKVLGEAQMWVSYQGQAVMVPLIVLGDGPSLLGRNWLNKIQLSWKEIKHVTTALMKSSEIAGQFLTFFQEGMGTLRGIKAIYVDSQVPPKFFKARVVPFALKMRVEGELKRLQEEGIISPVQFSDWAVLIVPIRKPNGDIRICGNYKLTVNQAARLDKYPISRAEELFAVLSRGKTFTKLDLSQAYAQTEVDEESRKFVTINTHKELFQYNCLPYGVASAPAIFQQVMDSLLQGISKVVVYLEEEPARNLQEVLKKLASAGLHLKKVRCKFGVLSVVYLGHKTDVTGLHPIQTSELKSFLGMLQYYAKFMPNLSAIKDQQQAYEESKRLLQSSRVLVHYEPEKELFLACDASPYGLGAVLSHKNQDGTDQSIAHASWSLNAAGQNYSQLDKESLSIMFGIQRFHQYVYGRPVTILTDHKPLISIFSPEKATPSTASAWIQRWSLKLATYNYTLQYRQGRTHANVDALSCLPLPEIQEVPPAAIKETGTLYGSGCLLWGSRVVVPLTLQEQVLSELHNGHACFVWWPKVDMDIETKVKQCNACQQTRDVPLRLPYIAGDPERPWSRIHIDYASPFMGKMSLVVVDAHSKWLEVLPVLSATAAVTIEKLRFILATHGLPDALVSDNAPVFTCEKFRSFCERNGIKHIRVAPYHLASNGLAE
uniref:Uncharacterized protein n=1 Tax=Latimeria chalumnae TaxID=7897 RepID=H3ARR4_LATCH